MRERLQLAKNACPSVMPISMKGLTAFYDYRQGQSMVPILLMAHGFAVFTPLTTRCLTL